MPPKIWMLGFRASSPSQRFVVENGEMQGVEPFAKIRRRKRRNAVVDFDCFYPGVLLGFFHDFAGDVADGLVEKVVLVNLNFCCRLFEYDGAGFSFSGSSSSE